MGVSSDSELPLEKRQRVHEPGLEGEGDGSVVIRRKHVALVLSYIGEKYHGMQSNPGVSTIEDELAKALSLAGGIPERDQGKFSAVMWSRAARTDKGVSAACQVVSLHLVVGNPGKDPELVDKINGHLPQDIRIHGILRTTGSFCARTHCDRRTYEYLLPVSVLVDGQDDPEKVSKSIARFDRILHEYVGTHAFHNFTERMTCTDRSRFRYIVSCSCSAPFRTREMDFVKVTIVGQSFVLHQIRNMVGLAIMVYREKAPSEIIKVALHTEDKIKVPMAPSLGLLLESCAFDNYNRKYATQLRVPVSAEQFRPEVDAFKRCQIYEAIAEKEQDRNEMATWLDKIEQSMTWDAQAIRLAHSALDRPDITAEEKRRERLASLYPIVENFLEFYDFAEDRDTREIEMKKALVTSIREKFMACFGEPPSMLCRFPRACMIVGDILDQFDLVSVGIALPDEVVCAIYRRDESNVKIRRIEDHSDALSADLKPNGSRLATTTDQAWGRFVTCGWTSAFEADAYPNRGKRSRLFGADVLLGSYPSQDDTKIISVPELIGAACLSCMRVNRWRIPRLDVANVIHRVANLKKVACRLNKLCVSCSSLRGSITKVTVSPKPHCDFRALPQELCLLEIRVLNTAETTWSWEHREAEIRLAAGLLAKRAGKAHWRTAATSPGRLHQVLGVPSMGCLHELIQRYVSQNDEISLSDACVELEIPMETLISAVLGGGSWSSDSVFHVGGRLTYIFGEALRADRLFDLVQLDTSIDEQGTGDVDQTEVTNTIPSVVQSVGLLLNESHESLAEDLNALTEEGRRIREWCLSDGRIVGARSSVALPSDSTLSIVAVACKRDAGSLIPHANEALRALFNDRITVTELIPSRGCSSWNVQQLQPYC